MSTRSIAVTDGNERPRQAEPSQVMQGFTGHSSPSFIVREVPIWDPLLMRESGDVYVLVYEIIGLNFARLVSCARMPKGVTN